MDRGDFKARTRTLDKKGRRWCGITDSEPTLKSAGTFLSQVRAHHTTNALTNQMPECLRSSCWKQPMSTKTKYKKKTNSCWMGTGRGFKSEALDLCNCQSECANLGATKAPDILMPPSIFEDSIEE
ncbi:hypothetical protein PoB_006243000 [Plakobranchus ocellatus]|uniref:Uncharacterized protein n=1 Tax=Plakobranchus ocellatus TaxID=259542 RepID=A0AAV4CVN0_9GAST|nr:hypothetical protein PoB_006243000 [Plakobranchus ocellatus]